MMLNNIKEYYYKEVIFNKKNYYLFLLLTSILLLFISKITSIFASAFFCFILLFFQMPKCNNEMTSKSFTNFEVKMAFLLYALYSLLIFALPQILLNILTFRKSYDCETILTFLAYYFISSMFYFIASLIMISFIEYEKSHLFIKIIFATLLIFLCLSPIFIDFIAKSNIKNQSKTLFLISRFVPESLYSNVISCVNTNCVTDDPLKINLSFVPRYRYSLYSCGFINVDYSMEILNVYLLITGISIIIMMFYYFDSITIEKYLRTLPLFKITINWKLLIYIKATNLTKEI